MFKASYVASLTRATIQGAELQTHSHTDGRGVKSVSVHGPARGHLDMDPSDYETTRSTSEPRLLYGDEKCTTHKHNHVKHN